MGRERTGRRLTALPDARRAGYAAPVPLPRLGWKKRLALACAVAALVPGWSGRLVPAVHDDLLAEAARSRTQLGVTRGGAAGEEWHLQYLDSWPVRMLDELGLRPHAARFVPPTFVAHLPPGSDRADGYFRVATRWHWPWWRPGGGLDWALPGG